MKTIKVSEATPIQLDWLVAKCEGEGNWPIWKADGYYCQPTKSWDQGGPIIERERLCARPLKEVWGCWVTDKYGDIHALALSGFGPTPLIAAMRCFVISRLGDTVEVPEELK